MIFCYQESIKSFHAAINPKLVKNKDNFLLKIRIKFSKLLNSENLALS